MPLLVANIPWSAEPWDPNESIAKRLDLRVVDIAEAVLLKRTVDGRTRPPRWQANYKVALVSSKLEAQVLKQARHGVRAYTERDTARYRAQDPTPVARAPWSSPTRPIVIGAGPAGLFAALRLGEAGAPAILLERGGPVEERHQAVRSFWRHGVLDADTNVVYGEGGAGAFSDGKIYTRRRDGDLGYVFRRLVDMGADPEILEEGWAHLGTDRIRAILPVLRKRLIELGVEVRFNAAVTGFLTQDNRCLGVRLANGEEIRGGPVLVATGHSARDIWKAMLAAGAQAELRPIHVGARIEHPQKLIDAGRYGGPRGDLPPASYRLTSRPRGKKPARPAHTFCMCPGGTVVSATNHPNRVVVNGMSFSKRQAFWANSAIIVAVEPGDYPGTDPLAGMRFQDRIESLAWKAGGGDYRAPAQRVEDFLQNRISAELPRSSYTRRIQSADLREVFPPPLIEGMKAAIHHFNKRIPGFSGKDGLLIAPETRTTAPLRFLRDENRFSTTLEGLMPLGEGAGYAGGIVSAALDGYRAALTLVERYAPAR